MSVVLRGLRARTSLTLAAVGMALLASAAAVVGPGYAQAASLSLLSARLDAVPSSQLGLSWRLVPDATSAADPQQAVADVVSASRRAQGGRFSAPIPSLTSRLIPAQGGPSRFATLLMWREDQCLQLRIRGRCPARSGEALMSASDARYYSVQLGSEVTLHSARSVALRVVGLYAQRTPGSDYWYDTALVRRAESSNTRVLPHSAPLLVEPEQFEALPAQQWFASADRPLDTEGVTLADVDASTAVAEERRQADRQVRLPSGTLDLARTGNQLSLVAATIAAERDLLIGLCVAATAPLVVLAIMLLYLLVQAAADRRRPELALAKLRGIRGAALLRFGLAEPVAVALLGVVTGALAGWLAVKVLATAWLRPDTPTPFGASMGVAAGAVFATAVLACAGALTSVVREPLRSQLVGTSRPGPPRPAVLAGQAAIVALAVATSYQIVQARGQPPDGLLGLLAPLFIALAAAVLGSFAMAWVARRWLGATRAGRGSAGFLAARRLARRRDGVSLTAPVVAAVALSVFAGCAWLVSDQWRLSQARMLVGADVAYSSTLDPWQTRAAVEEADPRERWLMATVQELGTDAQYFADSYRRLYVDASRFARVSSWDPSWRAADGGEASVQNALLEGKRRPTELTGSQLGVSLTNGLLPSVEAYLDLRVRDVAGVAHDVVLGPLPEGRSTLSAPVRHCRDPCQLEAMGVSDTGGLPISTRGTITVHELSVDGTLVDAGLADRERWRAARPEPQAGGRPPVTVLGAEPSGLSLRVDTLGNAAVAAAVPATEPAVAPIVAAAGTEPGRQLGEPVVPGIDGVPRPVRVATRADALPVLGTNGVLGDLSAFLWEANGTTFDAQIRVLARADTPQRVVTALAAAGIQTDQPERLDTRVRNLDADPYAMGLELYLVVAAASLLLAFTGVAAMVAVQSRWRSVEAAALRVVGLSPRAVLRSSLAEFGVAMSLAVVFGLAAGALALVIALPALPLGNRTDFAPPADYAPRGGVFALTAVVALVGSLLVAFALTRLVVSHGRPEILRETDG